MKQRLGGGFNPFSKIWVKMQIFLEWMWKLRKCFKPPPRNPPVSASRSPETLGWRVAWDARPRNHQKLSWERMCLKHLLDWECLKTWAFQAFFWLISTNVWRLYYKRFFHWCSNILQHDNIRNFFWQNYGAKSRKIHFARKIYQFFWLNKRVKFQRVSGFTRGSRGDSQVAI